jgi:hypothetical protein
MNKAQKESLKFYLSRIEGHTIDKFIPSISDRRDEPGYEGWIYGQNGWKIYMGIEPDGSRHT